MPVHSDVTDSAERIRSESEKLEPIMQLAFLRALNMIKDSTDLDELAELLAAGRIDEALRGMEAAAGLIANSFMDGVLSSAVATTTWASANALINPATFDPLDGPIVSALQVSRLEIIRDFSATQREVIQSALLDAAVNGLNPRQTALAFRDVIGLTVPQKQAIKNYREMLENLDRDALRRELRDKRSDDTIKAAINGKNALSPLMIDRLVRHYRERHLAFRAEGIARTESLAAANIGTFEAYEQMLRLGYLEGDELVRTWTTRVDGRERDSHRNLDGVTKRPGEVFQGFASTLRFPHDPLASAAERVRCRCALQTRLRPIPS